MKKETQNKTVLAHLQLYGTINSMQAINLYWITRLSARIYDLKELGHEIESNYNGNVYVTYKLIKK